MEEDRPRLSIRKIYQMVRPSIGASAWGMLFFCFLSFCGAAFAVAEPVLYGRIVDTLIRSLNRHAGLTTAWNMVVPFLILWIGVIFGQIFLNAIGSSLRWYLNNAIASR